MEAFQDAIDGAEEITRLAVREWDKAYHELALELGEKQDLAGAVKAAVLTQNATGEEATDAGGGSVTADGSDGPEQWTQVNGWWIERPRRRRVAASCGVVPKPYAVLSYDGSALLSSDSLWLHLAAVTASGEECPAPRSFSEGDLAAGAVDWV